MKNIFNKFINYFITCLRIPGIKRRIQRKINFIKAPKIFTGHIYGYAGGWKTPYFYYVHKNKLLSAKSFEDSAELTKNNFILILYGEKYFYFKMFLSLFGNKNIVRGAPAGTHLIFLLFSYLKKSTLVYSQNTHWEYNQAEKSSSKLKVFLVEKIHKNNLILCVSKHQSDFLKSKFGNNIKTAVIYNSIGSSSLKLHKKQDELNIIMIGSVDERKGVSFYGRLADYAKEKGQKWNFYWMGSGFTNNLYISKNVTFLKYNMDVNSIMKQIDIFFLSSIYEAFGGVVMQALYSYKKAVVYKDTGNAELIKHISGCGVYENYKVQDAYDEIQKVIQEPLDKAKIKDINEDFSSIEGFSKRLDKVLEGHWGGK